MATASESTCIVAALFHILAPEKPFELAGVSELSISDQLAIFEQRKSQSNAQRSNFATSLYSKLPDLEALAHKRIRFKSLLATYSKLTCEIDSTPVMSWKPSLIAVSLMSHIVQALQRKPSDDKDAKDLKKQREHKHTSKLPRMFSYTHRFCMDKSFDGAQFLAFIRGDPESTSKKSLALTYQKMLLAEYKELKMGQFPAPFRSALKGWMAGLLERSENEPQNGICMSANVVKDSASKPALEVQTPLSKHVSREESIVGERGAKWFWMNMEEACWFSYGKSDQSILDNAHLQHNASCTLHDGQFRVDLQDSMAAGVQVCVGDANVQQPQFVIKVEPNENELIHGYPFKVL